MQDVKDSDGNKLDSKKEVKEETSLKLVYKLNESSNYDRNAQHRITEHTLESGIVDIGAAQVDQTFTTIEVACQPNYAIGVFKDDCLMLTPLKKCHQIRPSFEHVDE